MSPACIEAKARAYRNRGRPELSSLVLFKSFRLSNQHHYPPFSASQALLAGHAWKQSSWITRGDVFHYKHPFPEAKSLFSHLDSSTHSLNTHFVNLFCRQSPWMEGRLDAKPPVVPQKEHPGLCCGQRLAEAASQQSRTDSRQQGSLTRVRARPGSFKIQPLSRERGDPARVRTQQWGSDSSPCHGK